MIPEESLPFGDEFRNVDSYIDSLLELVGTHELLRTLCGGVHLLDFFTSEPDLYSGLLPREWRHFFSQHEVIDLLDLFMRVDLDNLVDSGKNIWSNGLLPPDSLLEYIRNVRKHLLDRRLKANQCTLNRTQKKLAKQVSVGMNVKKVHEVGLFASYINDLANEISNDDHPVSHLIDFGSGQSYLGRALASEPYNRYIVAIESKSHNADRAKWYDVKARLVEKQKFVRNKKAFRAGLTPPDGIVAPTLLPTPAPEDSEQDNSTDSTSRIELLEKGGGSIQHVEHRILSGDLADVVSSIRTADRAKLNLMVISLHSCGNLVHHGLRSLILNPSVKTVAMVGCCYNLLTERLGPATYKHPILRPISHTHPELEIDEEASDPNGFPMSARFCKYGADNKGVRLNITARMMAVQAPSNWGKKDSEGFFTRHFYRALLQRVFLDRGVIDPPSLDSTGQQSPAGHSSGGTPIVIGSLRKSCYDTFVSYVRGALDRLFEDPAWGPIMREKMGDITNEDIIAYEEAYLERKKDLSVIWSLMAFSAGVVEAAIVVDRYLWLKEQPEVESAWVESVFDYHLSPRNLVVVGVKK